MMNSLFLRSVHRAGKTVENCENYCVENCVKNYCVDNCVKMIVSKIFVCRIFCVSKIWLCGEEKGQDK